MARRAPRLGLKDWDRVTVTRATRHRTGIVVFWFLSGGPGVFDRIGHRPHTVAGDRMPKAGRPTRDPRRRSARSESGTTGTPCADSSSGTQSYHQITTGLVYPLPVRAIGRTVPGKRQVRDRWLD